MYKLNNLSVFVVASLFWMSLFFLITYPPKKCSNNITVETSYLSVWGSWTNWIKSVDKGDALSRIWNEIYSKEPFNYAPRFLNETSQRLATVADVCKHYQLDKKESLWYRKCNIDKANRCLFFQCSVIVHDVTKTFFCDVPKVGSTNFKRYFLSFTNTDKESISKRAHTVAMSNLKMVSPSYYNQSQLRKLGYKKIMFTRHPFRRLVSAYFNKLVTRRAGESFYENYAVPIMKRYRDPNLDVAQNPRLDFNEFVRFLIDTPPIYYNEHWIPYWIRCEPCRVKYDYIGKMETMNEDTEVLFQRQLSNSWYATNDTITFDLFSLIPWDQKQKLYQIYRLDFEMFGYSAKEYL